MSDRLRDSASGNATVQFRLVIPGAACVFAIAVTRASPCSRFHHVSQTHFQRTALAVAALSVAVSSVVIAEPVPSIALSDGNVLDVQGVVGSGPNTSYEVVDFQGIGGPAFAWEYQYTTPVSGYQMLLDIQSAEPSFSVESTYFSGTGYAPMTFTYGSYTETADFDTSDYYWSYFNAQYDGAINLEDPDDFWSYAENGASDTMISNGSFDGWVVNSFTSNIVPNIPETAVPEPASLAALGSLCLLALAKPRRTVRHSR